MSEVARIQPQESAALTPMEMLDRALSSGASPDTLEKLMNLQERWEAANARKAYIANMAQARADFLPILKKHDGYLNRYKYEKLDDVIDAVGPALFKHGFNYDWITEDLAGGQVRVTCVITHEDGYQRTNSMSGDPSTVADAKANMNSVQRTGAVVAYLQRYTLKAALGVSASKDDDASNKEPDYDISDWIAKIAEADTNRDKARLLEIQAALKAERGKIPPGALKQITAAWSPAMARVVQK